MEDRKLLTLDLQEILRKAHEMSLKVLSWLSPEMPS
jgi:hypothetical protein